MRNRWQFSGISAMEMERPLFGQVVRQVVRALRSDQLERLLEIQRQAGGLIGLGQVMRNEGLITRGPRRSCRLVACKALDSNSLARRYGAERLALQDLPVAVPRPTMRPPT